MRHTPRPDHARLHARMSLLELVTALAIVMVLTALALPKVSTFAMRAKRAEVRPNVEAITDALVAYSTSYDGFGGLDSFLDTNPPRLYPFSCGSRRPRSWQPVTDPGWDEIGWAPSGNLYGCYEVSLIENAFNDQIWTFGETDLDVDGHNYWYLSSVDMRGSRQAYEEVYCDGVGECF